MINCSDYMPNCSNCTVSDHTNNITMKCQMCVTNYETSCESILKQNLDNQSGIILINKCICSTIYSNSSPAWIAAPIIVLIIVIVLIVAILYYNRIDVPKRNTQKPSNRLPTISEIDNRKSVFASNESDNRNNSPDHSPNSNNIDDRNSCIEKEKNPETEYTNQCDVSILRMIIVDQDGNFLRGSANSEYLTSWKILNNRGKNIETIPPNDKPTSNSNDLNTDTDRINHIHSYVNVFPDDLGNFNFAELTDNYINQSQINYQNKLSKAIEGKFNSTPNSDFNYKRLTDNQPISNLEKDTETINQNSITSNQTNVNNDDNNIVIKRNDRPIKIKYDLGEYDDNKKENFANNNGYFYIIKKINAMNDDNKINMNKDELNDIRESSSDPYHVEYYQNKVLKEFDEILDRKSCLNSSNKNSFINKSMLTIRSDVKSIYLNNKVSKSSSVNMSRTAVIKQDRLQEELFDGVNKLENGYDGDDEIDLNKKINDKL